MKKWIDYRFFYTDHYEVPLPAGHRFPMEKYRKVKDALLETKTVEPSQLLPAPMASREDLLLAHTETYVNGLFENSLDIKETRPIGLPMGRELLERSLGSVGGFIKATENALLNGFSAVLAGGTHHAHADRGEGFCVFNDFAVGAIKLIKENKVKKILIIDLDVHQGNGNSSILGQRDDIFILSLHGEKNYPFRKVPSHLDVPLPQGCSDPEYLMALRDALKKIKDVEFDIVFYQAGVDILKEDSLGTFDITLDGVMARDRMVFEFVKQKNKPIVMAMGGGYAKPIDATVKGHVTSYQVAKSIFK